MRKLGVLAAALLMAVAMVLPSTALGVIHEKIAAECRASGVPPAPAGQIAFGQNSFLRALQASGVITSIVTSPSGDNVTISFNPDAPASKFVSSGQDLTIPDAFGPGVSLTLHPFLVPDPNFPAFANCHNLNP